MSQSSSNAENWNHVELGLCRLLWQLPHSSSVLAAVRHHKDIPVEQHGFPHVEKQANCSSVHYSLMEPVGERIWFYEILFEPNAKAENLTTWKYVTHDKLGNPKQAMDYIRSGGLKPVLVLQQSIQCLCSENNPAIHHTCALEIRNKTSSASTAMYVTPAMYERCKTNPKIPTGAFPQEDLELIVRCGTAATSIPFPADLFGEQLTPRIVLNYIARWPMPEPARTIIRNTIQQRKVSLRTPTCTPAYEEEITPEFIDETINANGTIKPYKAWHMEIVAGEQKPTPLAWSREKYVTDYLELEKIEASMTVYAFLPGIFRKKLPEGTDTKQVTTRIYQAYGPPCCFVYMCSNKFYAQALHKRLKTPTTVPPLVHAARTATHHITEGFSKLCKKIKAQYS